MDFRVIWSGPALAVFLISVVGVIGTPSPAYAQNESPLVEIEYPVETMLPYRERRPSSQMTLGFQFENFLPSGYISQTTGSSFGTSFGKQSASLVSGSLGWKYNASFAGLEVGAFYGTGGIISNVAGNSVDLDFSKYGLKFGVFLETLFKEPYVVPYGTLQMQFWDVSEKSNVSSFSKKTSYAIGYQFGALIQLNWLDPSAALAAMNSTGLTNTYIDVFAQQYGDPSGSDDPRLGSGMNWGAGLRVEY